MKAYHKEYKFNGYHLIVDREAGEDNRIFVNLNDTVNHCEETQAEFDDLSNAKDYVKELLRDYDVI